MLGDPWTRRAASGLPGAAGAGPGTRGAVADITTGWTEKRSATSPSASRASCCGTIAVHGSPDTGPNSAAPIRSAACRCIVGVTWLYRLVNSVGSA